MNSGRGVQLRRNVLWQWSWSGVLGAAPQALPHLPRSMLLLLLAGRQSQSPGKTLPAPLQGSRHQLACWVWTAPRLGLPEHRMGPYPNCCFERGARGLDGRRVTAHRPVARSHWQRWLRRHWHALRVRGWPKGGLREVHAHRAQSCVAARRHWRELRRLAWLGMPSALRRRQEGQVGRATRPLQTAAVA